jgi:hypothetical protein
MMKKSYAWMPFLLVLCSATFLFAQTDVNYQDSIVNRVNEMPDYSEGVKSDTSYWKWGGLGSAQFGQTALVNWAAGGNSQMAVNLRAFIYADYKRKKHIWENSLNGNWGIVKFKGETAQINQNLFVINSQYGYELADKVYLSALANIQSPFTKGFDYSAVPKLLITQFAAPMFIKTSLGFDYKPTDWLSIFVSPLAGKYTIVASDSIAALNRYIPATLDNNGSPFYNNKFRAEFGALARVTLQKEIVKNVTLRSVVELFNNYTDPNKANRKNFDVDWQTGIDMKVNDWLAVGLFTHLIYDDNTSWAKADDDGNPVNLVNPETGEEYLDSKGNPIQQQTTGVQFLQNFTLGLTYKFGDKSGLK